MSDVTFLGRRIPDNWVRRLWGKLCPKGCAAFMGFGFNPKRFICMNCGYEERRV